MWWVFSASPPVRPSNVNEGKEDLDGGTSCCVRSHRFSSAALGTISAPPRGHWRARDQSIRGTDGNLLWPPSAHEGRTPEPSFSSGFLPLRGGRRRLDLLHALRTARGQG